MKFGWTTRSDSFFRWPFRLLALICITAGPSPQVRAADALEVGFDFFEKRVRPILVTHCYECHGSDSKQDNGGLWLDTRDGLLAGGASGPAIVAA